MKQAANAAAGAKPISVAAAKKVLANVAKQAASHADKIKAGATATDALNTAKGEGKHSDGKSESESKAKTGWGKKSKSTEVGVPAAALAQK